jgi:glycosyltransferase involved in cell wall biosynthesis
MEVSIVICCYNSAERIRPTLEHIKEQQLPKELSVQVILVDNNCADQTVPVAQEVWGQGEFELVILKEAIPGPEAARRCGINYSQSKYVLCCDDDNWLDPHYLATAYQFMESSSETAAVGGWGDVVSDVAIPEWFDRFKTKYACGRTRAEGEVNSLVTAGLFMRKSVWNELIEIGFKPILAGRNGAGLQTGEDIELTYAIRLLGWKLHLNDGLRFQHYMPAQRLTEEYLVRMSEGHGRSRSVLGEYRTRLFAKRGFPVFYSLLFNLKLLSRLIRSGMKRNRDIDTAPLIARVADASGRGSTSYDFELIKSGSSWKVASGLKRNFLNLSSASSRRERNS